MSGFSLLVVIICTVFVAYEILLRYGVFEYSAKPAKIVADVKADRSIARKRKMEKNKLDMYTQLVNMFRGLLMSEFCYEQHKFFITRLDIRTKYQNRQKTPEELRGEKVFPLLISLLCIPLGLFFPIVFLIPIACAVNFFTYQTRFRLLISDEDEIIDNYFIDLYLLLYSKLREGSRARLQGTVESYVDILEHQDNSQVRNAMLNFSRYFMNLLALYEDHVAVPMLKETYKSATIINFCNVCQQSLQGVNNEDNLLTFKMQLVERKTNLMRLNSERILIKGNRSIYAIWIILFIFIAVGMYSKLPKGFF